jgi:thioredoxin 1
MQKKFKIAIVLALVVAVVSILALKQYNRPNIAGKSNAPDVSGRSLPVLVDLGADKCIPCKMMVPVLDELKEEFRGHLTVTFIDVWKDPAPGRKYGIRAIPTQIFLDPAGRELFRHEGFFSKEDILGKWRELGYKLGTDS